jgi:hypothetical protein
MELDQRSARTGPHRDLKKYDIFQYLRYISSNLRGPVGAPLFCPAARFAVSGMPKPVRLIASREYGLY